MKTSSEYNKKPDYILVHNPCNFGMVSFFANFKSNEGLKECCLFREIPDCEKFSVEHTSYIKQMKANGLNVVEIINLISPTKQEAFKNLLENNPNLVYTRDAIITLPWLPSKYILGRMNSNVRKDEPLVLQEVAYNLGLSELVSVPEGLYLEGGDVIPFSYDDKRVLLVGYGRRTTEKTLYFLRDSLVRHGFVDEIIGFELADWRINLDGGFVPVSENIIISNIESIIGGMILTADSIKPVNPVDYFVSLGYSILHTTKDDSVLRQTCNCFCDGTGSVFVYDFKPSFYKQLYEDDLRIVFVKGCELVKGTGGTRCMTRPIYL